MDLTIRPGERIALVGRNGASKSTLIKLMMRLYDPTAGRITPDGMDLRAFDPDEPRAHFAVVIRDTSAASCRPARASRSATSATRPTRRSASATGSASPLPRALVRDAPLVVLDEPTSAMDEVVGDRTAVVVSHRLSTVRAADRMEASEVEDESILLDLATGDHFGLNRMGAVVWELLADAIAAEITARYAVGRAKASEDVARLLVRMRERGLVHVGPT